jgi:hypothetical protein
MKHWVHYLLSIKGADMPYRNRIATLQESHRLISKTIEELEKNPDSDALKISELKKKKLQYKDELRRLERLQWENDHESVDFGDDR